MEAAEVLGANVGLKPACSALGVSRATLYRQRARWLETPGDGCLRPPPLQLDGQERQAVVPLWQASCRL